MALDTFFREDVVRIMRAIIRARVTLSTDDRDMLESFCEAFGISPAEVLPPQPAVTKAVEPAGDGRNE